MNAEHEHVTVNIPPPPYYTDSTADTWHPTLVPKNSGCIHVLRSSRTFSEAMFFTSRWKTQLSFWLPFSKGFDVKPSSEATYIREVCMARTLPAAKVITLGYLCLHLHCIKVSIGCENDPLIFHKRFNAICGENRSHESNRHPCCFKTCSSRFIPLCLDKFFHSVNILVYTLIVHNTYPHCLSNKCCNIMTAC